MSRIAHPALPHPVSVRSANMSKMQRNHTKTALIQMKIQKLQSRTSPKSLVMLFIVKPFRCLVQVDDGLSVVITEPALDPHTRAAHTSSCTCRRAGSKVTRVGPCP